MILGYTKLVPNGFVPLTTSREGKRCVESHRRVSDAIFTGVLKRETTSFEETEPPP
jgi:hypothetical protein